MKNMPVEHNFKSHSFWNFGLRNFKFYLRSNLLLCAGSAVGALILTGALNTGFSLRESIRTIHDNRLGTTQWVLHSSTGQIRASVADSISANAEVKAAPVLLQMGSGGVAGRNDLVHRVNIIGVDDRFWELGPSQSNLPAFNDSMAVVNSALAQKLNIKPGEQIILRFKPQGTLAMDAPFGARHNLTAIRLPVSSVVSSEQFGDFSLKSEHFTIFNIFVPLKLLQSVNNIPEMASAVIISKPTSATNFEADSIDSIVNKSFRIGDAGLRVRRIDRNAGFEIFSDNVFINDYLKTAILDAIPQAVPVSAWFVNSISASKSGFERSIPYSFVSTPALLYPLSGDSIELGSWAAKDLNAYVGDELTLTYFVPAQTSGLRLDSANFVVSAVHKENISWIDRSLMPPYPGLADAGSCTEWDPAIPVDLDKIRHKDEEYWNVYEGTPKAVISFERAEQIWDNRFGVCTAVRVPDAFKSVDEIEAVLLQTLSPANCGIQLTDVRESIASAVDSGIDFAPLFIGLSFFTFAASLLLIWLLSTLQIKSRLTEYRLLMTFGYSRKHILVIYLSEGVVTFSIGIVVGVLLSPLYTLAVIEAMKTIWHAAAQAPSLNLHIGALPFVYGGAAAFICALVSMIIPIFSITKNERKKLKTDTSRAAPYHNQKRLKAYAPRIVPYHNQKRLVFEAGVIFFGFSLLLLVDDPKARSSSGIFFISGTLFLTAAISFISGIIDKLRFSGSHSRMLSWYRLITLNIAQDKRKTLGQIMVLACALYIMGTTQLFHHQPVSNPLIKTSGTGGFLWYGELNSGIAREHFNAQFLRENNVDIKDFEFLSLGMRVKDGDDASCFNLNRTSTPVLLGADQTMLDSIGAFSFASVMDGLDKSRAWLALGETAGDDNTIYGIADAATIEWGLGKSIGDSLKFVNEKGDTLNIILSAGLKNSVLQGKVIIAESDFIRYFPSISGYRLFLSTPAAGMKAAVADALQNIHSASGLNLELAAQRLSAFNSVENTYLSIFALLGMMGLMLGCAGMGVIVMRNIEERRYELALLMVQGFSISSIKRMLFSEHLIIALAGTFAGLLPALAASWPAIQISGLLRIVYLLAIVLFCGIGSIMIGLRGLQKSRLLEVIKRGDSK
ncbi:MAG: ABC transporter permease [Chitinispirillales bacterium]|jgi:ABC-type antimicrobial peptide transport system permease subunit|nr:ABC transporter permease [Chitinispirillales bacterium]